MSRLDTTFAALRRERRTGLVAYVTAGDPDLARTEEILVGLAEAGASVLEVGVPFSDPLADGPVIQRASHRAVSRGTTLAAVIALVSRVRRRVAVPIVLFSYANPILRLGVEHFASAAAEAGVDGVLVLDLPLEEAAALRDATALARLDQIFLVSPTTTRERIRRMAAIGSGFLYAVSRLGVTGSRDVLAGGVETLARRIRAECTLPIAVGFGISHPDHVREVGRWAEAAVVGSSLVAVIEREGDSRTLVEAVREHVRWLLGQSAGVSPGADAT